MRKRKKTMLLLAVFLALLFLSGGGAAVTVTAQDAAGSRTEGGEDPSSGELTEEERDELQRKTEDSMLEAFDFQELEDSLVSMFPKQKISFGEIVSALTSGDLEGAGEMFLGYLSDQISYEFRYNRQNLVYMLLIALAAAVFTNFAGAFRSRQVSEISFYVLYMLLITLCLTAFRVAVEGVEERLGALTDFMQEIGRAHV